MIRELFSSGVKSPGSPEESHNATPPSLSHVTSSQHQNTSPPSSTSALSPGNTGTSSPPTTNATTNATTTTLLNQSNRPNLGKLKRFLSTLVQFGAEINSELGDKVRNLVFSMVVSTKIVHTRGTYRKDPHGFEINSMKILNLFQNGNLTIEEFHTNLQDATNFPLRPFVLPFLKTHLPLLQKELAFQARIAKQVSFIFIFFSRIYIRENDDGGERVVERERGWGNCVAHL
mgnify:CR=1 FL=1